jgi:hypothetical protein
MNTPDRSLTRLLRIIIICSIVLQACSASKKVVVVPNVAMSLMPGYITNDSVLSHTDFNVWLVTTEPSFDSLFTTAITSAYKPDFSREIAVAIRAITYTASYKVTYKEMLRRGNILDVYFTVRKEKPEDEGYGWVSITAFPKNQDIKRVNFFHDNVMIKSIPVVIVY